MTVRLRVRGHWPVELSTEDRVWNEACDVERVGGGTGIGDRHLRQLIRADRAVMSGGVGFAADVLSVEECAAAIEACRYFALDELADLFGSIASSTPDDDDGLQAAYDAIDEQRLIQRVFRQRLQAAQQDVQPL